MNIFKFFKVIRKGDMYACVAGDYVGHMFMYFDKNDKEYAFLKIPTMENFNIPKIAFDSGLKNGILEFVDRPPKHVRNICKAQFQANGKELRTSE